MKRFLSGIFCLFLLAATSVAAPPKPIKVLLLDGESAGVYHNWQLTTPILKQELNEAGIFDVTVLSAPAAGKDFSGFHPNFSEYKVVVSNLDSAEWPDNLRSELEKFVGDGGGLVIVHAADNAFAQWPAFNLMAGIGGWRNRDEKAGPMWYIEGGKVVSDPTPGRAGEHGARLPFKVVTRAPEHPIMRGLPAAWMHNSDELYGKMRGPGKNMTILATAHSDPANHGTGHEEPMLMTIAFGKGRVFHTTMGHDPVALSCVGFIVTLQRGTEWAATGAVTQAVPKTFPTENTVSFRTDIAAKEQR